VLTECAALNVLDQHVHTIKSCAIAGNVLRLKEIDYRTQTFDNRALLGFALTLEIPLP
jgi:hypothetical protein